MTRGVGICQNDWPAVELPDRKLVERVEGTRERRRLWQVLDVEVIEA